MKLKNMAAGLLAAAMIALSAPYTSILSLTANAEERTSNAKMVIDGNEMQPTYVENALTEHDPTYYIKDIEHTYEIEYTDGCYVSIYSILDEYVYQSDKSYIMDISWDIPIEVVSFQGQYYSDDVLDFDMHYIEFDIKDGNIGSYSNDKSFDGLLTRYGCVLGSAEKEVDVDDIYEYPFSGAGSGSMSFTIEEKKPDGKSEMFLTFYAKSEGKLKLTIKPDNSTSENPKDETTAEPSDTTPDEPINENPDNTLHATLTLDGKETAPDEISEYGTPVYRIDGFEHTYKVEFSQSDYININYVANQAEKYTLDISWDMPSTISGRQTFFDADGVLSGGHNLFLTPQSGDVGILSDGYSVHYYCYLGSKEKELKSGEDYSYCGDGSANFSFATVVNEGGYTNASISLSALSAGTIEFTIRKADQATDEPTEEPDTPNPSEINYETGEDVKVTDYITANGDTDTELHVISITKEQAMNNPAYDVKATITEKDGTKKSYTVRTENCYKGFAYNTADGKKTATAENGYFIIVKINDLPDGSFVSVDITAVK